MVVALHGYSDARSYKGWQELGRQVRKGEKAFYILEPMRVTRVDEETGAEYSMLMGFKSGARFGIEQTDGDPLPEWLRTKAFLSYPAASSRWRRRLGHSGQHLQRRSALKRYGVFRVYTSGDEAIALGVENLSTWTHELVHAADHRLGNLTEKGQHWSSETVAELGGCILLHILGKSEEADMVGRGSTFSAMPSSNKMEPLTCMRQDA